MNTEVYGFPAVLQCRDWKFTLSLMNGKECLSKCFNTEELEQWFGKEIADKLNNLQDNQGVYCKLVPVICELTEKEIERLGEISPREILNLS